MSTAFSNFHGLHSRKHDHEVELCAFDMLVSDGEDLARSARTLFRHAPPEQLSRPLKQVRTELL